MSQVTRRDSPLLLEQAEHEDGALKGSLDRTGATRPLLLAQHSGDGQRAGEAAQPSVVVQQFDSSHFAPDTTTHPHAPQAVYWTSGDQRVFNRSNIECDGEGGVKLHLFDVPDCAHYCAAVHENTHRKEVLEYNPDICKGQPEGTAIHVRGDQRGPSEVRAANATLACLDMKLRDKKSPEKEARCLENYKAREEKYLAENLAPSPQPKKK